VSAAARILSMPPAAAPGCRTTCAAPSLSSILGERYGHGICNRQFIHIDHVLPSRHLRLISTC
jgi:hypothetical protein